ncbi:MAG: dihydrofolate reductase [Burkholderiales bacterium]|nr:dihydrofolate reductase [Burkholderiales bacterium]
MTATACLSEHDAVSLAVIAAVARNGVIGAGNALPWRLPEDLKRFRTLTIGHTVIMGRKTWDSLPRALPGRQNIVVSRRDDWRGDGAEAAHSFADALARVRLPAPAFCIGGGELYAASLPYADVLHVTEIDRDFGGDARFPRIDREVWCETGRVPGRGDDGLGYAFVTYVRTAKR